MKLDKAVVIVTGASAGIGLAVARALAARGATVVLAARDAAKLAALEKEIPGSLAVPTDMRDPEAVRALVRKAKEAFGRVDILVNNAGQGLLASVEATDIGDYRTMMDLNVFAVLRAMQEAIPLMREQGKGMILNISSMVSKNYFPGLAAYASTKYALNALSLTARTELEGDGIVVSVFHPKMTATDFGQNALGQKYVSAAGRPGMLVDTAEQVAERVLRQLESEEPEANM